MLPWAARGLEDCLALLGSGALMAAAAMRCLRHEGLRAGEDMLGVVVECMEGDEVEEQLATEQGVSLGQEQ